jgi:hypothetical protein
MDHHRQEVVGRNHLDLVVVGSRHHHRNHMRRVAGNPAEAAGSLDRLEEVHLAVVGFLHVSCRSFDRKRATHLASSSRGFSMEVVGPGWEPR